MFDRMVVLYILCHNFHTVRNFPKIPVFKAPLFLKASGIRKSIPVMYLLVSLLPEQTGG